MNETNAFFAGGTVVLLVVLIVGALNGCRTESYWHNEAVKAGKGEYYLDENNNKQWRWK